ncbi:MAG: hypothetical protein IKS13_02770 [Ruminococcus sp.]|nr:hypothetical protein [Ruminococcus sp.]
MNREKMSKFIADYLQNDKTTFAMMLSGEWGTGKSFYIKGELKNFIEEWKKDLLNNQEAEKSDKKEIKKYELIIVSLYGLSSISEISQRIYFEMRTILKNKSEKLTSAQAAGKIIGKTLLNAFSSKIGFDIETDAGSFDKIYESIDLTGKLLVFEDVERTKIDLEDFFGYVNNLCEQDNVKVLLVADENKIREKFKEKKKSFDDIKDKVVGDTIHFEPDLEATLRNIFDIYGFNDVCDLDADMSDIRTILPDRPNFRKVIYACQKVHEIFNHKEFEDYRDDEKYKQFRKNIFLSTLLNVHKGLDTRFISDNDTIDSNDEKNEQTNDENFKKKLYEDYPLPYFVYNYLTTQQISKDKISTGEKEYANYIKCQKNLVSIPGHAILKNSEYNLDADIENALKKAGDFIADTNNMFYLPVYRDLIKELAFIKDNLEIETDEFMDKLVKRFSYEAQKNPEITQDKSMQYVNLSKDATVCKYDNLIRQIRIKPQQTLYKKCNGDIKQFFSHSSGNMNNKDIKEFIENTEPKKLAEFIGNLKGEKNDDINIVVNIEFAISIYIISKDVEWFKKLKDELSDVVKNYTSSKVVKWHIKQCIRKINKSISPIGLNDLKRNKEPQMSDMED